MFTTNGKVDGHCRSTPATQIMGGLLGALLHPAPRTSLVIGLGSGSSAGWLAAVPEMTRVDAVELEPSMLEVARRCAVVNEHALDNPKLHVVLGDAREVLSVTPERYDIVFSEPSNPYRAGVASLYTRQFYDRVLQHLKPGGMFLQWVQAYEIDEPAMRTIFATAATAFPYVETWQLECADLLLVGSAHAHRERPGGAESEGGERAVRAGPSPGVGASRTSRACWRTSSRAPSTRGPSRPSTSTR